MAASNSSVANNSHLLHHAFYPQPCPETIPIKIIIREPTPTPNTTTSNAKAKRSSLGLILLDTSTFLYIVGYLSLWNFPFSFFFFLKLLSVILLDPSDHSFSVFFGDSKILLLSYCSVHSTHSSWVNLSVPVASDKPPVSLQLANLAP